MNALSSVSNHELRERLSVAVGTERAASAEVIFHLAELDRRKLYLEDAAPRSSPTAWSAWATPRTVP